MLAQHGPVPEISITFNPATQCYGFSTRLPGMRPHWMIDTFKILIHIWSNFLVPSLPDTSLCEAQGDGGGRPFPAGCRKNGKSCEKIAEKLI